VKTEKGDYNAKTILFATGTKWKKLEVPGSEKFERKGISYCALCDGPLFRNKTIAVVGGSDSAAKEALLLSQYAKKIYIISRSDIHPEIINLERLRQNKKIEVLTNTNIKKIEGDDVVKRILLDKSYKGKKEIKIDGIFVSIGHIPLSDLAKPLGVKLNERGEIKINHETAETNIKGIFAAGDITDKKFKQLITGVSDGCTAAYYAYEYITKNKVVAC
jgi:thioredoxin reductase